MQSGNGNPLLLSRKSSDSSTGSVEKAGSNSSGSDGGGSSRRSGSSQKLLRHDEHSVKSVRDKIALFSSGKKGAGAGGKSAGSPHHQSSEDVGVLSRMTSNPNMMLTRAYTHGDVRHVGNDGKEGHNNGNSVNSAASCSCIGAALVSV